MEIQSGSTFVEGSRSHVQNHSLSMEAGDAHEDAEQGQADDEYIRGRAAGERSSVGSRTVTGWLMDAPPR